MPLSGDVMRKLFDKAGWKVIRQNGSHMRVQKG
jgi:predicted RNA binding protein YcfA (HicA-like mRNA interferase family)